MEKASKGRADLPPGQNKGDIGDIKVIGETKLSSINISFNYINTKISIYSLQINSTRNKEEVFADLVKVFDSWIGDLGDNHYMIVCEECNRNTVTICTHLH